MAVEGWRWGRVEGWRWGRFGRVVFHRHRALAPQKNAVDAKLEKTSLSASVF
jgi:hypothetical protein